MSNNIKSIIFDLGRVIVGIDILSLGNLFNITEKDPDITIQKIMSDNLMLKFNSGKIAPEQFHKSLCNKYNLRVNYSEFKEIWCSIFKPMPDTEQLLRQLHGNVPLGLLSDTDVLHWNYLIGKYPILDMFHKPTLSFEIGATKPSSEAYIAAAKNVDTEPQDCLFIDDLEENVAGARSMGMDSIHFKGIKELREELTSKGLL